MMRIDRQALHNIAYVQVVCRQYQRVRLREVIKDCQHTSFQPVMHAYPASLKFSLSLSLSHSLSLLLSIEAFMCKNIVAAK
jgi:hypothetical protein